MGQFYLCDNVAFMPVLNLWQCCIHFVTLSHLLQGYMPLRLRTRQQYSYCSLAFIAIRDNGTFFARSHLLQFYLCDIVAFIANLHLR